MAIIPTDKKGKGKRGTTDSASPTKTTKTGSTSSSSEPTSELDINLDVTSTLFPVGQIKAYENNPRKIEKAIPAVAASLKAYGFRQPLVCDEDMVLIAGHVRLEAAKSLGLKMVPVHVAYGLTEEQKRGYRLVDNKSNERAMWDYQALQKELSQLDLTKEEIAFSFEKADLDVIMQAEWKPEEAPADDSDLDVTHPAKLTSIKMSQDGYEIFKQAAELIRDGEHDAGLHDGDVVVVLCRKYLNGEIM